MEKNKIEQELRLWFTQMLDKFTWLQIKFEYNRMRDCFMVSFSPEPAVSQDEKFCTEALAFEDKMNEEYGDDAPLFCDNEELFKLSSNAEVLTSFKCNTVDIANIDFGSLFDNVSYIEMAQSTGTIEFDYNNEYKIAA